MTPKLALFLREFQAEREQLHQPGPEGKPINPCAPTHASPEWQGKRAWKGEDSTTRDVHLPASCRYSVLKPTAISEAPGHSSDAFTMDTYSHIIEGM